MTEVQQAEERLAQAIETYNKIGEQICILTDRLEAARKRAEVLSNFSLN